MFFSRKPLKLLETESFAEVQFVIDSCRFISQSNYLNNSNNDCDWLILAELRRPKGPPSGAPYSSCRGKIKVTRELIFSWLSWLAVLLVGAFARRRRRRRSCPTWRPYSKKETYSLSLPCTYLILDIPTMIN